METLFIIIVAIGTAMVYGLNIIFINHICKKRNIFPIGAIIFLITFSPVTFPVGILIHMLDYMKHRKEDRNTIASIYTQGLKISTILNDMNTELDTIARSQDDYADTRSRIISICNLISNLISVCALTSYPHTPDTLQSIADMFEKNLKYHQLKDLQRIIDGDIGREASDAIGNDDDITELDEAAYANVNQIKCKSEWLQK